MRGSVLTEATLATGPLGPLIDTSSACWEAQVHLFLTMAIMDLGEEVPGMFLLCRWKRATHRQSRSHCLGLQRKCPCPPLVA